MLILNEDGELIDTQDVQKAAIESCFQELQLWKGENPLDIDSGVDYAAVFDQTIFLKPELERVCEKHAKNFRNIEVGEPEMGADEIVRVKIVFRLFTDEEIAKKLSVKASR